MSPRIFVLVACLATGQLRGDSKTEKDLRAQITAQAVRLAAQTEAIADLTNRLTAARIQLAAANSTASAATTSAASARAAASSAAAALMDVTSRLAEARTQTASADTARRLATEKLAGLQAQLSVSRVQTATAKGAVVATSAEEQSRRAEARVAIQHCSESSQYAALLSEQVLRFAKADSAAGDFHKKTMAKIDHSTLMIMRLLVIMFAVTVIKFTVALYIFRRKR